MNKHGPDPEENSGADFVDKIDELFEPGNNGTDTEAASEPQTPAETSTDDT